MTLPKYLLLFSLLLAGCNTAPVEQVERVIPATIDLQIDDTGSAGLNVGIRVFDSEETVTSSIYVAASQVRFVEQRYLPYVLKRTLDRSGYWGAVRVMPRHDPSAEIRVEGRVIKSNGSTLAIHLRVFDATGRTWIDEIYRDEAEAQDYSKDPDYVIDPFRDLYHRVANDMAAFLQNLDTGDRRQILNTALVRYGNALSPDAFSRYFRQEDDQYRLVGLPAAGDPLLTGVRKIRESEYLFADSMDTHFELLYRTIGPTYAWWRYYNHELVAGNERIAGIDATRGASKGSWYAMERIYKTFKEAKMNQDALRELSESFGRETATTSAEVAGRMIELNGSLDNQYQTWRRILKQMYLDEAPESLGIE